MSALEKRIERLEQVHGTVKSLTSMVEFVCPSRGLVGLRYGDFTMSRRDDETEVQFLLRSKRELEESMP
ncbi:MAG: hypothetical protein PWQ61_2512 [Betaproteobacteria bacterium]|nr:hypothetical protein [Betaproteobacteria bacterium]